MGRDRNMNVLDSWLFTALAAQRADFGCFVVLYKLLLELSNTSDKAQHVSDAQVDTVCTDNTTHFLVRLPHRFDEIEVYAFHGLTPKSSTGRRLVSPPPTPRAACNVLFGNQ
jgi:hypothetical protein